VFLWALLPTASSAITKAAEVGLTKATTNAPPCLRAKRRDVRSEVDVDVQLTSHMENLKVRQLCLAAFAAAWAIDGNARRSSAG
jgi:hypothetical protein